jgi:NAD(P)-dependent dehydrogenase (short-subunit alcohol dehydrogenase family)
MAVDQSNNRGSVVVTGTSTGIGAATVTRLASLGFDVFAGIRRTEDAEVVRSRGNANVTPLLIDITDAATIAAAVKTVGQAVGDGGLAGLVNNAGIVKPGPLEFQPLDDFRHQLEVNLVGPLAVTQAFLPLIRRGRGRIVNVGSIGGLLVLPIEGAYSASKFGLEALSDALRLELRQWKIPVSHVDPGVTSTPIFGKTLAELDLALEELHGRGHHEYDAQFAAIRKMVEKLPESAAPADDLARAIADALTAKNPRTRYHAGRGSHEAFLAARTLSDHAKDKAVVHEVGLPEPE